jgi:hypothetical protein
MRSLRPSVVGSVLLASALIAMLALLPQVPVPVRALAIVGFALVCPGFAWVRLLGIEDRLAEWTLGIASSIAIATLVASIQAYAGAWSPKGTIVLLAVIVLGAVASEPLFARDRQEAR